MADKEKKENKENETKRKGGVLSLILALVLVLAAAGLAALSFTSTGYPLLEEVRAAVISWASFRWFSVVTIKTRSLAFRWIHLRAMILAPLIILACSASLYLIPSPTLLLLF